MKAKTKKKQSTPSTVRESWVDSLSWTPLLEGTSPDLSIVTWNVLAQSYCSRRSHPDLPRIYQDVVFSPQRRRSRLLRILKRFVDETIDVLCLQEVDSDDIARKLQDWGYSHVETPRTKGGGSGGRVDSCGIYVRKERWSLVDHELIRLDDLATLGAGGVGDTSGLEQSFLRRNAALLARIRNRQSGRTVVVANAHLFWNPGFEYVKLCQAHYVLQRAKAFAEGDEPFVFTGDLNSRPRGVTHRYLTSGFINAKKVAPWNLAVSGEQDELLEVSTQLEKLDLTEPQPQVKYMLDATLNKLCRWLRILGIDAALETDEEEKKRTGVDSNIVIFRRCVEERRVLVTTSLRLLQRRDCPPGAYCIKPNILPNLEVALVHMLLTHGLVLDPSSFLSRCSVCNGSIVEVYGTENKRNILEEYQAPPELGEDMEVYQCDGCGQGYWWNDLPTSSASRVKTNATRLFELCLRAGVPYSGDLGMFDSLDPDRLRRDGWDFSEPGSDLLNQKLDVIDWLRTTRLECPYRLRSAYCADAEGPTESLPFTNVTSSFVNTLDYVFADTESLVQISRLDIPTSFPRLNDLSIQNGHLLPSDVWPSDHLAIGAMYRIPASIDKPQVRVADYENSFCLETTAEENLPPPSVPAFPGNPHGQRCACGCVPQIRSLFEMAELRKQAKMASASREHT